MGTVVTLDLYLSGEAQPGPGAHQALARARAALHRADAVFSLWKPDSPMSALRRGELTPDEAPPEVGEVLELCATAREMSRGFFDPWAMPGGLDPTGLVKGWAAARALGELAVAPGCAGALVNAGGDVAVSGSPAPGELWRVGIQDPARRDRLAAVVEVEAGIATSGTYERGAHLIDPRTGRSDSRFASASITGPDLAIADALATALAVAGGEGLEVIDALAGYEALAIGDDGRLFATPGLRLVT